MGVWLQVVYKRYASLYFVMGIDMGDNELITLEIIHHYVEVLDRYFGNVCELDLIFNFHKVSQQLVCLWAAVLRNSHTRNRFLWILPTWLSSWAYPGCPEAVPVTCKPFRVLHCLHLPGCVSWPACRCLQYCYACPEGSSGAGVLHAR